MSRKKTKILRILCRYNFENKVKILKSQSFNTNQRNYKMPHIGELMKVLFRISFCDNEVINILAHKHIVVLVSSEVWSHTAVQ